MNVHNSFVPDIITPNLGVKVPYDDNDVILVASISDFLQHLIYSLCDAYPCIIASWYSFVLLWFCC